MIPTKSINYVSMVNSASFHRVPHFLKATLSFLHYLSSNSYQPESLQYIKLLSAFSMLTLVDLG